MKRLLFISLFLLTIGTISVSAFTVDVESSSTERIVLAFRGFTEFPVIQDVTAQAETGTLTDRYVVDTKLSVAEDKILLEVDVSEIFEDYAASDIKSITVSGVADGDEFAKRVAYRETSAPRQLAPGEAASPILTWVGGILLLIVFLVLLYFAVIKKRPAISPLPSVTKPRKKASKKKGKKTKRKKKS